MQRDPLVLADVLQDVWSVGVLAYEMLVGFPPFVSAQPGAGDIYTSGDNLQQFVSSLANDNAAMNPRELRFPPFVTAGAQDFIAAALADRPGDRPTALQLLRHPWLKHSLRQAQFRQQKGAGTEAAEAQERRARGTDALGAAAAALLNAGVHTGAAGAANATNRHAYSGAAAVGGSAAATRAQLTRQVRRSRTQGRRLETGKLGPRGCRMETWKWELRGQHNEVRCAYAHTPACLLRRCGRPLPAALTLVPRLAMCCRCQCICC